MLGRHILDEVFHRLSLVHLRHYVLGQTTVVLHGAYASGILLIPDDLESVQLFDHRAANAPHVRLGVEQGTGSIIHSSFRGSLP